ncbi:hypothetical protein DV738_g4560, partial [Chaetothyriales sp. CBS 135597]
MSSFPSSFLHPFLTALRTTTSVNSAANDHPNYYNDDPSTLVTSAQINDLSISTGASLYSHFEPVLLSAEHSLIIVTCFWARSESLNTLNHLRVRICFSSLSVTQKLFHTRALSGQTWPPATWVSKLGLPPPSELTGLDLQVKSIFVLPFSVMHPKFIIVDGRTVLLPSCNVSWEDWSPATPLNTFLLTAITHATRSVVITTPNLTSPPLISAILSALRSGVDITIYTSARMMLLEQLLTAGTVTEWCI